MTVITMKHSLHESFAILSGDHNPLHMNELAARRLLFGRPVIHGVHSLLCGLEVWASLKGVPFVIEHLHARFPNPVGVGEEIDIQLREEQPGRTQIRISSNGKLAVDAQLAWRAAENLSEGFELPDVILDKEDPVDLHGVKLMHLSGSLDLGVSKSLFHMLFQNLYELSIHQQIACIIGTTRIVGMKCPGLHSIYSQMDLSFSEESDITDRKLSYSVERVDERFSLVFISIWGARVSGSLQAFLRPIPSRQKSFRDVQNYVANDEFSDQQALVVGGSRGLGEVTSKILAAGGARVVFTYNKGEKDAQLVASEILEGGGKVRATRLNIERIQDDLEGNLLCGEFTHVYYFATPYISQGRHGLVSTSLLREFVKFYVFGLSEIMEVLTIRGVKRYFNPLSIYLSEPTRDFKEYITAKRMSKTVCGAYEEIFPDIVIHSPELPRVQTDQTRSMMPGGPPDPMQILLNEVRQFAR